MPQFKTIVLEKSGNHAIIIKKNSSLYKRGVIAMSKRFRVDVILQHNTDGTIIPMRLRFTNNDGERVEYTIRGYKDLSGQETRTMPDGVFVTSNDLVYQCRLIVNNQQRYIYLHRDPSGKS